MFLKQFCIAAIVGLLAASLVRADSPTSVPMPPMAAPTGRRLASTFTSRIRARRDEAACRRRLHVCADGFWVRIGSRKKRGEYDWSQYEELLAAAQAVRHSMMSSFWITPIGYTTTAAHRIPMKAAQRSRSGRRPRRRTSRGAASSGKCTTSRTSISGGRRRTPAITSSWRS